jgi:hypothetical protein
MGNHKKAVETLFKKKIIAGHFTQKLLKESIIKHTQALKE